MKSSEIRSRFLSFFAQQSHQEVSSSSLVPANDPTLLFTNAGMVQFKDVFLGEDQRNYSRATSSQRCVRAGGKHNDLENVGYTARHHTFFEMLGNFSFGDYFKREAIKFAWQFLTVELKLPPERLWVTVYKDDDEAADIWLNEMGLDPSRFSRLGDADNFWSMGDTGPCGPCSEIFYDHGEHIAGGPPGSPDDDLDRYIEIWNLVFMQYNQDANGQRTPLPKPSVDTGMGMERIAAVLQGVHSNYEIDIFQHLIKAASVLTTCNDLEHKSLRVIADHIRSCAFLIADGVIPSNEGRGYVLRRIIRRAIRHGNKLGVQGSFFHKLVISLAEVMADAYPELNELRQHIEKVLLLEEEQFAKTLDNGMKILNAAIDKLTSDCIDGQTVFKLYDTYGFPLDLTADIARERQLLIDEDGFHAAMLEQKQKAKAAGNFSAQLSNKLDLQGQTQFSGYQQLNAQGLITHILKEGQPCSQLQAGEEGVIVLDQTSFYAESGGQAGENGLIHSADGQFEVSDCLKQGDLHLHIGRVTSGSIKMQQSIHCEVFGPHRQSSALHHSATHLLHAALRQELGAHVQQKGSLVNAQQLRFDFSHLEALTATQIERIEQIVNKHIQDNSAIRTDIMDIEQAKQSGAMALFGEKYDDEVRVLTMGTDNFSVELCGGIHAKQTGDLGLFKITSESGIAAGVRRIEAVSGLKALTQVQQTQSQLHNIARQLKTSNEHAADKVEQSLLKNKQLEKEIAALKSKLAANAGSDLASQAKRIGEQQYLLSRVDNVDAKALRELVDQLKNKLGSACVVIAAVNGDKLQICAGVTKDLIKTVKAGELVNQVATKVGGKGGGKPDLAMAGGSDIAALDAALIQGETWLKERLKK